jgi:DHA2 family methylenomycin A resistance protein-like MFS transporter
MQTTSPNIRAVAGRPEQAHSDNTSSRSPLATALALAAMSLGLGVVQLDITIVNTALSSIGASLGGSVAELQWVVTAYTIAFAAFILTAGALGDRLGAKRIFMAGFAIFTLASLACALAPPASGSPGVMPRRRRGSRSARSICRARSRRSQRSAC